eukprot:Hpha_TRINITY_DN16604_c0_g1::TRINITY_DN16604_c0_g1_i1::g.183567::m.183567
MPSVKSILKPLNMTCGVANAGAGILAAIMWLQDLKVPNAVLAAYMFIFGCLQVLSQFKSEDGERMNFAFMRKNFGMLGNNGGLGIYLLFLGSLGLGFGWGSNLRNWVPFLVGCATLTTALICFAAGLMCKSSGGYGEIVAA